MWVVIEAKYSERITMEATPQKMRQSPKTWYRDGFIITSDASMIDLEDLQSQFLGGTPSKLEYQREKCYLVLMTPTPIQGSQSHQIGYLVFQTNQAKHQPHTLKPVLDQKWDSSDLRQWIKECAKDWLNEQ